MNSLRNVPIKFRALSIADRVRVEGFYFYDDIYGDCICNNIRRHANSGHAYCDFWRIDPDSLEQLVGFDNNDNEIYDRKARDSFAQYSN